MTEETMNHPLLNCRRQKVMGFITFYFWSVGKWLWVENKEESLDGDSIMPHVVPMEGEEYTYF